MCILLTLLLAAIRTFAQMVQKQTDDQRIWVEGSKNVAVKNREIDVKEPHLDVNAP